MTHRLVLALRIWLVVLLALLLPVRGAMAAAMLCPPGGMSGELRMVQQDHAHAEHATASADAHHAHDHPGHHAQGDSHAEHEPASPDRCNMCAAFCSMTPMPASSAGVPERLDRASVSFPELNAPAPTFLSDGQERPPRSI